jgi:hypothetical protein
MSLDLEAAMLWTMRLIALAVLLQTVELWQCRRAFSDDGVFQWKILALEHHALPSALRWFFALLLPYRSFLALLVVRAAAAVLLGGGWASAAPVLLLSQLAIAVRFRGTFNGGSDYMSVIVLLGLSIAGDATEHPLAAKAGLAYIAVQSTLSYFVAGVVKVRNAGWRNGSALVRLFESASYGVPASVRRLLARPAAARSAALSVMAFECSSPVIWARSELVVPFILVGLGFHVGAAITIGLNRFLFAWASTYPALLFCTRWADRGMF